MGRPLKRPARRGLRRCLPIAHIDVAAVFAAGRDDILGFKHNDFHFGFFILFHARAPPLPKALREAGFYPAPRENDNRIAFVLQASVCRMQGVSEGGPPKRPVRGGCDSADGEWRNAPASRSSPWPYLGLRPLAMTTLRPQSAAASCLAFLSVSRSRYQSFGGVQPS